MKGVSIGHSTIEEQGTGVSVFIFEQPATGAYTLCGSSPASHEMGALDLEANVTHVDALMLTGGSAFGLAAVNGVMRWLREQKRGWATPHALVPIVPAAAIYDLGVKKDLPPSEHDAYQACVNASEKNTDTGRIGAGTGASVGKLFKEGKPMSGGIGRAEVSLPNGVTVMAYAVVNSVGDVRDKKGNIIAGSRVADQFADGQKILLSGDIEGFTSRHNTTLVALFTNAKFSKIELKRISKMAVAGMARAISPVFTRYDGDLIFSFSVGEVIEAELIVGAMAAEATELAIQQAVVGSIVL